MQITDEFGCLLCEVEPSNGRVFLGRAMLRRAQLQNFDLRGAVLSCADLRGANLEGADLSGALLDDADLTGASLKNARLAGANLERAKLVDANVSHVDLSATILRKDSYGDCAVLTGARIEFSNLGGQRISGDFTGTSFQWSDLSNAEIAGSLTRVRFDGAQLEQARLFSDFCRTSFCSTDLSKIGQIAFRGKRSNFEPVLWNRQTKWPAGLRGYLLAHHLMTWDELHPFWIILFAVVLALALETWGLFHSRMALLMWIGALTSSVAVLRVAYVRHRKERWM